MWKLLRRKFRIGRLTDNARSQFVRKETPDLPTSFRNSLQIRHLDCGSCNGCDWELTALSNPVYDLQRYGIDFVASPRHADLLICTGTGSAQLLEAVRKTYAAMPNPKWIMAVGDCAVDGGVFCGTYASENGLDGVLPVDIKVPGCPPSPEKVMKAILDFIR